MRRKVEPLLCELHAHSRWSDGAVTLPELVDLYGTNGFDVLAVTDHVTRRTESLPFGVHAGNRADYFAELAAQAERARRDYDLLVLPGLFGWKTLLPCAKREDAVVEYLRSRRPAFLTRTDHAPLLRAA